MNDLDINIDCCRRRQTRLLAEMRQRKLDLVIVQTAEHVQWLTGPRFAWLVQAAAMLTADGRCTLIAPQDEPVVAADEVVTYDARWLGTLRNDQRQACSAALAKQLAGKPQPMRVGVEFSCFAPSLANKFTAELVDIEPDLYRLRRRKEPDELARLKKAIAATGKMYQRARQIIEPGVNELDVFDQLQAVAVEEFGEMLTGTGNDYACGEKGGPPRNRRAQDGELYILDLGPAFRGYFADNCRAVAVNGKPTDKQRAAWERLAGVFPLLEQTVNPGMSCRAFYQQIKEHLDAFMPGSFDHHLGHGIGLFPHEGPHLNPSLEWNDVFEVGDVFTVEPGLYTPEMRAGIRLENFLSHEDSLIPL
ncbi:MAG TPA: Xaa-Pro peptidase family protein, partial [Pirellulales bacterium]|nr:Xaa-Pro peptidase family protein [Pirellulales bacterium]